MYLSVIKLEQAVLPKKPYNVQNKKGLAGAIKSLKMLAMTDSHPFLVRTQVFTQSDTKADMSNQCTRKDFSSQNYYERT